VLQALTVLQFRGVFFALQLFAPATPDSCFQSFPTFMAGVIIAANDGVQERAQDGHTALD
jgi:hypothetical protein